MSSFVEEVAEPDDANGFAGEIHRKSRGTAREHAGYGVEFLTATAQIVLGDDEIGGAEGGTCHKQNAILAVPKSMAGSFGKRRRLERLHHWSWRHPGWLHSVRAKQRGRDFL